ncbi:MAG: YIP1 family protein [Defluviitaleaceae bacterium]|nr:YIP1 family protein [Defluviitaleaceae bacterium]
MKTLISDLKFIGYTCTHPFNGFYELRFRRQKNWVIIVGVFLLVGLLDILGFYHTGMLVQGFVGFYINPMFAMATAIFPFLIFAVSNWSVTSIFDGNGKFGDIMMVLAYALVPKLIIDLFNILLSNIVILPEVFMLNAIGGIGMIIFAFLVFCGLCVVHEYSPARCIGTLLATAAAAVLIIFIGVVYMVLMSRLIGLITTVFAEVTRRGVVF